MQAENIPLYLLQCSSGQEAVLRVGLVTNFLDVSRIEALLDIAAKVCLTFVVNGSKGFIFAKSSYL